MKELISAIKQLARQGATETIAVRRHLHMHPELSFKEFQSAEYIASRLEKAGLPWQRLAEGTGIVAQVHGSAEGGAIRTIALRADMDALPIQEENEVDYRSRNLGVMHACGHDAHCAILLSAGAILKELSSHFAGTIQLIFQPGEERCPGGAQGMIAQGVLQDVDVILGEHINPHLPAGMIGFRPGAMMASVDEIYLSVHGKGGHAASPHLLIDPVVIASHIIIALQQVVSRQSDPDSPCVLSFGKITADGATNIIPASVHISGTFRTFNEEWHEQALDNITQMASHTARGMGGSCEVNIVRGYPVLKNDEYLTRRSQNAATEYLGDEQLVDLPRIMWAEDFAYYNQKLPGCFYNIGVGNEEKGWNGELHSSTLMIDERALEIGSGLMAYLAISELLRFPH